MSRFASLRYSEVDMDVIAVKPLQNFELALSYEDGSQRRFDMKPLLALKPWNKLATAPLFSQVKVAYGTVVWPGEIDIAPETLLLDSILL